MTQAEYSSILHQFKLDTDNYEISSVGRGHINDSYKLTAKQPFLKDLFLQRINQNVFVDVDKLMENTISALESLNTSYNNLISSPPFLKCGEMHYCIHNNNYYRVSHFLSEYRAIDPDEINDIFAAGTAYGNFIQAQKQQSVDQFHENIPYFHNIVYRSKELKKVILEHATLPDSVKSLITVIEKLLPEVAIIQKALDDKIIPLRICHNDAKMDNILRHNSHDLRCAVVDLDTVMSGTLLYDYGDAVRSVISVSKEDQPIEQHDLKLMHLRAFHQGYMDAVQSIITKQEIDLLHHAIVYIPLIMGMRFLTDYLNGNKYYKIKHEEQNLHRAKNQISLADQIWNITDKISV